MQKRNAPPQSVPQVRKFGVSIFAALAPMHVFLPRDYQICKQKQKMKKKQEKKMKRHAVEEQHIKSERNGAHNEIIITSRNLNSYEACYTK